MNVETKMLLKLRPYCEHGHCLAKPTIYDLALDRVLCDEHAASVSRDRQAALETEWLRRAREAKQ